MRGERQHPGELNADVVDADGEQQERDQRRRKDGNEQDERLHQECAIECELEERESTEDFYVERASTAYYVFASTFSYNL